MMEEALSVKLRYEQIIKNLIKNENEGNLSSVLDIIAKTQAQTKVSIDTLIPGSSLTVRSQQVIPVKENYDL